MTNIGYFRNLSARLVVDTLHVASRLPFLWKRPFIHLLLDGLHDFLRHDDDVDTMQLQADVRHF